jgi:hypothetical protein
MVNLYYIIASPSTPVRQGDGLLRGAMASLLVNGAKRLQQQAAFREVAP